MSDVACFLITPTTRARRELRRFTYSNTPDIPPCPSGHHDAAIPIGEVALREGDSGCLELVNPLDGSEATFAADPRWPTQCERCGWMFSDVAQRQVFWEAIWTAADGREMTLRQAEPGAMYYADWYADVPELVGPDGRALIVILPNGHAWHIDGRASNCDSPCATCRVPYKDHYGDARAGSACGRFVDARPHKCWVRHGEPPVVTVDKAGVTCGAGAGSILSGNYHGFLRQGRLQSC
jgi:hypothetical protein